MGKGCRKKDILAGLLQMIGAMRQRVKATRRKWTATQIHQLVDMVGEMGRCWVKIARELNREPRACMERFYAFKGYTTEHAGEWTLEELQRLYGQSNCSEGSKRAGPVHARI